MQEKECMICDVVSNNCMMVRFRKFFLTSFEQNGTTSTTLGVMEAKLGGGPGFFLAVAQASMLLILSTLRPFIHPFCLSNES